MQQFATQEEHKERGTLDQTSDRSRWQEIVAASGISVRIWRLYASFWLVCLLFPILLLVQTPVQGWPLLIAATGLLLFTTVYFWVIWPHPLRDPARRFSLRVSVGLILSLTILVLLLTARYGDAFLWLYLGVSAIAGLILSFRNAAIAVMALTLLTLGISLAMNGVMNTFNWLRLIPLLLLVRGLGLDMVGFVRLSDALRELQRTREALARQAVTEERLRMARDLHDLLGHTLSLITLKSELAGRLVEKDPQKALQEIREVEQVARQALREVREAASGYRQPSLPGELEGARQMLEAAGIACRIDNEAGALPPNVEAVLAWVVREGVTNVIRHSRAQQCSIQMNTTSTDVQVEISNDGYLQEDQPITQTGSGLSGLTERVRDFGGAVEAHPQPVGNRPGFLLKVKIPIQVKVQEKIL